MWLLLYGHFLRFLEFIFNFSEIFYPLTGFGLVYKTKKKCRLMAYSREDVRTIHASICIANHTAGHSSPRVC